MEEIQSIEALNNSLANDLRAMNSDNDVKSQEDSSPSESFDDQNDESAPTSDSDSPPDGEVKEQTDEPIPQEQAPKQARKKDYNERVQQLISERKQIEETARQHQQKAEGLEQRMSEIESVFEQNKELIDIADALSENPEIVDQFKEFLAQKGGENDPYSKLDPLVAQELKRNKESREAVNRFLETQKQREEREAQEQTRRARNSKAEQVVGNLKGIIESNLKSANMAGEESRFIANSAMLEVLSELALPYLEKAMLEIANNVPEEKLKEVLSNHLGLQINGIQKLRGSVKKSLAVPHVPPTSRGGHPAIQTQFGSIKEVNDSLALELRRMRESS